MLLIMDIFKRIFRVVKRPIKIFSYLGVNGYLKWVPDEIYLKILYRERMNKNLNLKKPKTYNEKLQWLKLNDRKPSYTDLVNKYKVRKYIADKIGEDYLIPLLGVYDKFEEINFEELPNQFVLKCTHDSGGIVICKDKLTLDVEAAKEKINKSLNTNYYYKFREWPYKNVKPLIICEKYMVDESGYDLKDYKFFCFNGTPRMMYFVKNRQSNITADYYDMEFEQIPVKQLHENSPEKLEKPVTFEKMKELSTLLSKEFRHIRVDFYEINGAIFFGELTFYHFTGLKKFYPQEYDEIFGDWLKL